VIMDFAQMEAGPLRDELWRIASGLNDIVPPPAPAREVERVAPAERRKRTRNPRGISSVKRLSYQVTPSAEEGKILLNDLLGI